MKQNKYYIFGKSAVDIVEENELNFSEIQIANKIQREDIFYEILEFNMSNPNPDLLLAAYDGWMAHYPITKSLYNLLKKHEGGN